MIAVAAVNYENQWQKNYLAASPEVRAIMKQEREKAQKEAQEERRHQELLAAIRATKPDPFSSYSHPSSSSPLPFLCGFLLEELL